MSLEYYQFIERINKNFGINLTLYKETQMKRRLTSLKRNRGYEDFSTYYLALQKNEKLLTEFIDRITINVSEFYRNPKRWSILQQKILPMLTREKQQLTIWSAACSSGEEPYSIALIAKEYFPDINIRILATDLDEKVIKQAKKGIYNKQALKNVPKHLLMKYFIKKDHSYHLSETIKKYVSFQKHDLLKDSYPKNNDLVVCRNVLIYFTDEAKQTIYNNLRHAIARNGVLFVGSTEQIFNPNQYGFSVLDTFFYFKK